MIILVCTRGKKYGVLDMVDMYCDDTHVRHINTTSILKTVKQLSNIYRIDKIERR
jgi:hypothetical protein